MALPNLLRVCKACFEQKRTDCWASMPPHLRALLPQKKTGATQRRVRSRYTKVQNVSLFVVHGNYHTQKMETRNKGTRGTSQRNMVLTTELQRQYWVRMSFTVIPSILSIIFVVQVVILVTESFESLYAGLSF